VVVHDLDVVRVTIAPGKADAPLVIDANTMLTAAIAAQRFEPVPRRGSRIPQFRGAIELPKFPPRDLFNCLKAFAAPTVEQRLCLLAAKRLDHQWMV
jgi:hypothetical protein